jgi:hypothetical protein
MLIISLAAFFVLSGPNRDVVPEILLDFGFRMFICSLVLFWWF